MNRQSQSKKKPNSSLRHNMSFLRAYISKRQDGGFVYVAERSPKGHMTFLWSIAPLDIHKPETRINPSAVPLNIRREAYKAL
jgi:hypothetical protein